MGIREVTAGATALALSFAMCGAYCAMAEPAKHERVIFASVDDAMLQTPGADTEADVGGEPQREPMLEVTVEDGGGLPDVGVAIVDVGRQEAESGGVCAEDGYEYQNRDSEPQIGSQGLQGNPDGLNSQVGVIEHDGHVETAYSSNVAYHVNTPEWTPDDQGFYRTQEGYYVVASSDYEQGTVIETSQGKAMVLDDGCSNGVVDFYTNWN